MSKPFLLYRGLDSDREEDFKIYPVQSEMFSSVKAVPPFTHAPLPLHSFSTLPRDWNGYNGRRYLPSAMTMAIPFTNPYVEPQLRLNKFTSSTSYENSTSSENSVFIIPPPEHGTHNRCSLSPISSDDDDESINFENKTRTETEIDSENDHLIQEIKSTNAKEKVRFKCNYKGCHYKGTFLSKDYLRRHIREQHRRSKEHICMGYHSNGVRWGCNKKFSRPYQLVNHWRGQRSLKRCGVPRDELSKNGIILDTDDN